MKEFLPNTHNIHIIKPLTKKPKEKVCQKCLSFSKIKYKSGTKHTKVEWCQYYGKPCSKSDTACKNFK